MNRRRKVFSILGIALYVLGILLALSLCGWYGWGGAESERMDNRLRLASLKTLRCPLMLAETETASVSAVFENPTNQVAAPNILAEFSQGGLMDTQFKMLTIEPGGTQTLTWTVGPENVVYGRLILVSVFESWPGDAPTQEARCIIMISMLPGLSGKQALILFYSTAFLLITAGAILWLVAGSPLKGLKRNATRACVLLTIILLMDMLSIPVGWWALSIIFSLAAVLFIGVIITNFVFFPTDADRAER